MPDRSSPSKNNQAGDDQLPSVFYDLSKEALLDAPKLARPYSIIDAMQTPARLLRRRLMRGLSKLLLQGATEVHLTAFQEDDLGAVPIFWGDRPETTVTLAVPNVQSVGRDEFDACMVAAVSALQSVFAKRPCGTQWLWHGRGDLIVYEQRLFDRGVVAVDVHGPRAGLQPAKPAWGPAVWPQRAVAATLSASRYNTIITPDREGSYPAEYVTAKSVLSQRSGGVHCWPEAVESWTAFLEKSCSKDAVLEVYAAPANGSDPAIEYDRRERELFAEIDARRSGGASHA